MVAALSSAGPARVCFAIFFNFSNFLLIWDGECSTLLDILFLVLTSQPCLPPPFFFVNKKDALKRKQDFLVTKDSRGIIEGVVLVERCNEPYQNR